MKQIGVHFVAREILDPSNPISVNLIGVGGTGSHLIYALDSLHATLQAFRHPGLNVRVFDEDDVSPANIKRQRFVEQEIGMNKAVALVNRINRSAGYNWKAIPFRYSKKNWDRIKNVANANITLSCVDEIDGRFEIADVLMASKGMGNHRDRPYYWIDFGNAAYTGQVLLSTVIPIKQPDSVPYACVDFLPFVTEEFRDQLLEQRTYEKKTPSCSLAQAVRSQELFINPTIANQGAALLYSLFREKRLVNRGFFLNLKDFRSNPIRITPPLAATANRQRKKPGSQKLKAAP